MPSKIIQKKEVEDGLLVAVERWAVYSDKNGHKWTGDHTLASDIRIPMTECDKSASDLEIMAYCKSKGFATPDAVCAKTWPCTYVPPVVPPPSLAKRLMSTIFGK